MSSLVEELQRDALDGRVDVSDLLRKAYVVASKLKLDVFKTWAECEMNGYGRQELPLYRQIVGRLRAWNPYNGWIPVVSRNDAAVQRERSMHYASGPIAPYQDLLSNGKDTSEFLVHVSPEFQRNIDMANHPALQFEVSLHVPRSAIVRILDSVRNTILQWSVKLQEDGITGDGMSFSTAEREIASDKAAELQRVVNFINIGQMVNSSIQQDSPSAQQNFDGR